MATSGGDEPRPKPPRLVLASASPARLQLLRQVGLDPEQMVSGVDETADGSASEVAQGLARRKALTVAEHLVGEALVVGCDSILEHQGRMLGKPSSAAEAVARWHELRGTTGRLHSGLCLVSVAGGRVAQVLEEGAVSSVRFATPSDSDIAAYVATGEPLQVAGAFTIDGLGAAFVQGIDGCPSNVVGLSLPVLQRLLGQLGLSICDWW